MDAFFTQKLIFFASSSIIPINLISTTENRISYLGETKRASLRKRSKGSRLPLRQAHNNSRIRPVPPITPCINPL
ncbi:MAG: hypothetical protein EOO68_29230 [Moraxellaceae bacterium]|nr:MAG: hypothetical protein EOO68_29230 [Moraxellaceae bacterium]